MDKKKLCHGWKRIWESPSKICLVPQFPTVTTWIFNTDSDINQLLEKDDDFEMVFSDTDEEYAKRKLGYTGKVTCMLSGCYNYSEFKYLLGHNRFREVDTFSPTCL